jgi:hypothetical protein
VRVEITVEITLVRFEITLVHVVIADLFFAFLGVGLIAPLPKITHNYTHTCQKHTLHVEFTLLRVEITVLSVVITFCECQNHTACGNHSCACLNHFRECCNYICASQNHSACDNNILRVEISLFVWKSHSACINHTLRVNITLFVCEHQTMRVNIPLAYVVRYFLFFMRANVQKKINIREGQVEKSQFLIDLTWNIRYTHILCLGCSCVPMHI